MKIKCICAKFFNLIIFALFGKSIINGDTFVISNVKHNYKIQIYLLKSSRVKKTGGMKQVLIPPDRTESVNFATILLRYIALYIYFQLPAEKGNIQNNPCSRIFDNGSGHLFTPCGNSIDRQSRFSFQFHPFQNIMYCYSSSFISSLITG